MDGVRGYWNGKELLSRNGKVISCPAWFTDGMVSAALPSGMTLDGELWMGRGTTHVNITTTFQSTNSDWNQIGYYIFDIPSASGTTYEGRMEIMNGIKPLLPTHVHVVENIQCVGLAHLYKYLDSVVAAQGEGVMLRQPNVNSVLGYTSSILKVKV